MPTTIIFSPTSLVTTQTSTDYRAIADAATILASNQTINLYSDYSSL
ncbi:hypothetical protein [[Scytonema hofmanni] UTEX B 1581]|nr:hypothetical protein [[Scytonema hofmanni] UTEX B 1581]